MMMVSEEWWQTFAICGDIGAGGYPCHAVSSPTLLRHVRLLGGDNPSFWCYKSVFCVSAASHINQACGTHIVVEMY